MMRSSISFGKPFLRRTRNGRFWRGVEERCSVKLLPCIGTDLTFLFWLWRLQNYSMCLRHENKTISLLLEDADQLFSTEAKLLFRAVKLL